MNATPTVKAYSDTSGCRSIGDVKKVTVLRGASRRTAKKGQPRFTSSPQATDSYQAGHSSH